MNMKGPRGTIRCGYQTAATLGAWSIVPRAPKGVSFEGALVDAHDYWLDQDPLDLVLAVGSTEWIWRGITVVRAEGRVYIDLLDRPIIEPRRVSA